MKPFFLCTLLLFLLGCAKAQPYVYATISAGTVVTPGDLVTATGSFATATVLPNFTITVTSSSNKISSFANSLGGTDELPEANSWESKYGNIDANATICIKVRHAGNASAEGVPLGIPISTKVTFNTATPASGWGFMVLDIDVDEVDIRAKDPAGNFYSDAQVSSWFKAVFDAYTTNGQSSADGAVEPPCFSAATATVVGSEHVASPCVRVTTLSTRTDYSGAGAWFEPDLPVKELEFIMNNLQPTTATPSERYFIAAASVSTVPVTLQYFTATQMGTAAYLNWRTAQESGSKRFEIEQSTDGSNFRLLNTVSAAGNTARGATYSITDTHPAAGNNYYRLKMVDADGKFNYSDVRIVNFLLPDLAIISPNPVTENMTLVFDASFVGKAVAVNMINSVGQVVLSKSFSVATAKETFSVKDLPPGVYYVKMTTAAGQIKTVKAQLIKK